MTLSILVPYRTDGAWRERAWDWNRRRIEATLPDAELVVEGGDLPGDHPDEFCHPAAVNRAAARAHGDVFLVLDADTTFNPRWVVTAAHMIAQGQVPWMLPRTYRQLTQLATERLLGEHADVPLDHGPSDARWEGHSVSWAGVVMVPRQAFAAVNGYDERFTRWGADDVAFAAALNTLVGPVARMIGAATHLWHPRTGLDAQPQEQHDLMHRYISVTGDESAMRDLIAEVQLV